MRKVERDLIAAIRKGKRFKHTKDEYDGYGVVRLYGHIIAQLESGNPTDPKSVPVWRFNLRGYNTVTTRSRINAIARAFNRSGVNSIKGQAYCDGAPINHHDWF